MRGDWIGEGAWALGLTGEVADAPYEALHENRHPLNGGPFTPRDFANRVAFFDIQLSAPKDVSVLAMVGGDERVRAAFSDSVKVVRRLTYGHAGTSYCSQGSNSEGSLIVLGEVAARARVASILGRQRALPWRPRDLRRKQG